MKLKFPYSLLLGVACVFLTQVCGNEPVVSLTSKAVGVDVVIAIPNAVVDFHHLAECLRGLTA